MIGFPTTWIIVISLFHWYEIIGFAFLSLFCWLLYSGYKYFQYDSLQLRLATLYDQIALHQFPEKLYTAREYYLTVQKIQLFRGPRRRKLPIKYADDRYDQQSLYIQLYDWINDLDICDSNNQVYILLFLEMQENIVFDSFAYNQAGSIGILDRGNHRISLEQVTHNLSVATSWLDIIFLYILFLVIFGGIVTIFSGFIATFFYVCLFFTSLSVILFAHIGIDKRRNIIMKNIRIWRSNTMKIQFLCSVFKKLSDSEISVSGMDIVLISAISHQIDTISDLWKYAYTSFSDINDLFRKRSLFFCLHDNQNYSVQDMLEDEYIEMKSHLLNFQFTLAAWIQSHMKDLQNYQQEIHRMYQLLSQNKNENAEAISLLEKNFNLHLQSMQKVENII